MGYKEETRMCDACGMDKPCRKVRFRVPGMASRFKPPGWACRDCRDVFWGSWRYTYDAKA